MNDKVYMKCGSSPSEDKVKLFRFPQPRLRNLIRCELWAQYVCPEGQYSSIKYQTQLFDNKYMLCDKHFKDSDFTDNTRTKLMRTAVPSDYIKEDSSTS